MCIPELTLDVLSNHKLDKKYFELKREKKEQQPKDAEKRAINIDEGSKKSLRRSRRKKWRVIAAEVKAMQCVIVIKRT